MATENQFDKLVAAITKRAGVEDKARFRSGLGLIRDAQREIVRRLDDAGEFETVFLRGLKSEVEGTVVGMHNRLLDDLIIEGGENAIASGTRAVVEPLALVNIETIFPAFPSSLLDVWEDFSTNLITGITRQAVKNITHEIDLASIGAKSRNDAMAAIGRNLKDPSIFNTIANRAEVIYETELKRIRSQAKHLRFIQADDAFEGMEHWWLDVGDGRVRRSHVLAGARYSKENAIPISEDFIIGGHSAQHPRAWTLPARESVRCRCEEMQKLPDSLFN